MFIICKYKVNIVYSVLWWFSLTYILIVNVIQYFYGIGTDKFVLFYGMETCDYTHTDYGRF